MWSNKQESFFCESTHSFNIASGSVSSGKTYIFNIRWLRHIWESPKNSLLIMIGKTSESLRDNVLRYILEYDAGITLDEQKVPMRLHCSNGVEVVCAGGDNEAAWKRIQGKTTAGAYFDEVTTLPQTLVQNVCKGCRWWGKTWPKFMTMNPDHPRHYAKKDYIDNEGIDRRVWYFELDDNPSLSDEYKEEVKSLYSGTMYERMILGKWVQAEGVVYDEFDRAKHVFTDAQVPEIVKRTKEWCLGIDWGWEHQLAISLWAIDYDGKYWQFDELYQRHQHIDESLQEILKSKGWLNLPMGQQKVRPSYAYADNARPEHCMKFNQITSIPVLSPLKDVWEGITTVKAMTKLDRIMYHERCVSTFMEKESYRWRQKGGMGMDEPIKEDDHLMDAERYVIHTREQGRVRLLKNNPFSV